ncbi:MAG: Hsp20/alpha crystallin family protein [Phycisphaeraceae bacterium]
MFPIKVRRVGRDPWDTALSVFHRGFDRLFDPFWDDAGEYQLVGAYPVDIREDDEHLYVEAELPGFKKDEIDVTLENGTLTISAERKTDESNGTHHLTERRYTRVARRFTLPNTVSESDIQARLDNGVLHLTLNKREEVKPRKIDIK